MIHDEPANILIVDDLPEKLLVYRSVLEGLGQNLVAVRSGEEALRAVLQQDFAVILLDVQMPGMSGLETASLIRRRRRSAHTPIIFLTAFADEVRAAEGYAQGAVDYITTPIVPGILQAKIRVFVDLYRMAQQVKRQAEQRVAWAEERVKREAAEEANHRLVFLARSAGVLGQSLDPEVAAQHTVRLPIPDLADFAALITRTPEKYFFAQMGDDGPTVESGSGPAPLEPDLADAASRILDGEVIPPNPGPIAAFPLRAGGKVFAALLLSRRSSHRSFAPADLAIADSFVSRSAIALENARLYREVQHADRKKNEFLSMLAHELRNPLAPIRNATVVIGQKGNDPARVQWAHGVIDRQLSHLTRLVDDLLDVSRITLGKIRLELEPVPLDAIVHQAVEAVGPLLEQFRHQLEVSFPDRSIRVHGDKARLTQVFINLLNNAAKYTEPGGRIWLSVDMDEAVAVIRVRDTGVGISTDLLPHVFDLFTQANQTLDRSQGGLGVGLTLIRRLVEMHGGTVQAASDGLGQGSEFIVRLPAHLEMPILAPAPPDPERVKSADSLRVVVVDDNVDGADSLADLLGILGHEVRVAYDGPSGITTVKAFDPDIVLLDIGLPGLDGYEVARRLRVNGDPRPVLVAISGYGQPNDRGLAYDAGFATHLVKPVEFETLRSLLESHSANPECRRSASNGAK